MDITGIGPQAVTGQVGSLQAKTQSDFAQKLAQEAAKDQKNKNDKKLRKACQGMESLFLNMLLSDMRKTVPKDDLYDSSQEDIMQSMLDTDLSKIMAKAGGIGLASMMYRQLTLPSAATKSQAPK
jgi:flagellar protein FlgJ